MKVNSWEKQSFEQCLQKVKYTKKLKSDSYLHSGKYPIVSQEDSLINGYWEKDEDVFCVDRPLVVFGDHTRILKYIDFNFVLGADGVKILLPKENLVTKFFYYYLLWYDIPNLGYSRHYKLLKEIEVPIPPLSIQEKIVKELDTLNDIISKKKAQLAELDLLAQATFYEMFGDPVENEKAWEVKALKCFGQVLTGNTPSRKEKKYYSDSYIEWIKTNNITENLIISQANECLSKEGYKIARSVKKGAILVTCIAGSLNSIGRAALTNREVCFNQQINAIQPNSSVNSIFLYWLFKTTTSYIQEQTPGVLKFILSKSKFEKLIFISPPLPLQDQFAQKIESIEQQKALIQQSIIETQLLFDYTMDKYFNE